jgi:hypothetical protein
MILLRTAGLSLTIICVIDTLAWFSRAYSMRRVFQRSDDSAQQAHVM